MSRTAVRSGLPARVLSARVLSAIVLSAMVGALVWSCAPPPPPADLAPLLAWRAEDLGAAESEILTQVDSALEGLRSAVARGDRGPALAPRLGEVAMLHQLYQRTDRALEAYALASARDPDDARWPYYEALLRHQQGDLEGAVAALERCLATGTVEMAPRVRLAETLTAMGEPEAAGRRYADLRELHPDSVRVRVGWAETQLALGHAAAARDELEPLARAHPTARRVRLALGRARRAAGDLEGARELLGQLPPLSPADRRLDLDDPWVQQLAAMNRSSEAAWTKARALLEQGLPEPALVLLGSAIERQPERPAYWTDLGTARERLGQLDEAETAYLRALELDSRYLPALAQLGALQQRRGRYDAAITVLDRLLAIDSQRPTVWFLKAETHRLAGDLASALDAFDRSLELDPADERVLIGLVGAHFQLGDLDAAARTVARGLTEHPDSFWFRSLDLRLCAVSRTCSLSVHQAERLFRARATAFAAETLAMVHGARGEFDTASRWQDAAVDALVATGAKADLALQRQRAYRQKRLDVVPFLPEEFGSARIAAARPETLE